MISPRKLAIPESHFGVRGNEVIAGKDKTSATDICRAPANPKIILLRSENKKESPSVAVKVDKVREVVIIPNEDIQKVENAPHLLGKIAYKSTFLYLLDMEKLLVKIKDEG